MTFKPSFLKSISGIETTGLAPSVRSVTARSLSTTISRGRPVWAHLVVKVALRGWFRSRPCTKGVAIASAAQAAVIRSPDSKARRWGVLATVTG